MLLPVKRISVSHYCKDDLWKNQHRLNSIEFEVLSLDVGWTTHVLFEPRSKSSKRSVLFWILKFYLCQNFKFFKPLGIYWHYFTVIGFIFLAISSLWQCVYISDNNFVTHEAWAQVVYSVGKIVTFFPQNIRCWTRMHSMEEFRMEFCNLGRRIILQEWFLFWYPPAPWKNRKKKWMRNSGIPLQSLKTLTYT